MSQVPAPAVSTTVAMKITASIRDKVHALGMRMSLPSDWWPPFVEKPVYKLWMTLGLHAPLAISCRPDDWINGCQSPLRNLNPARAAGRIRRINPTGKARRAFDGGRVPGRRPRSGDVQFLWITHNSVTCGLAVPCVNRRGDCAHEPHPKLAEPRPMAPPVERGFDVCGTDDLTRRRRRLAGVDGAASS